MRILLVEDDKGIAGFVLKGLRESAFAVDLSVSGNDALYQISINDYDLIVLDVMIPEKSGFEVCRELRQSGFETPILMLTARDSVKDRIEGLDAGADDYLVKPFAYGELLARIRALLRRKERQFIESRINLAGLEIDTKSQMVWLKGREISLTTKEFTVLEYFARNADRVIGREELSEHCWDETYDPFTNSIEVFVNRLRKKLDTGADRSILQTKRGAGYILQSKFINEGS
ncbi:MAG: response regulator transcription factor [Acidobacteria bacterium]|nr:response regulator transcription factor [Acidobacteriota bacterium]